MQVDQHIIDEVLKKVREGSVTAIRREVVRCRKAGLPLYVSRNGVVEVVLPDGSIHPVERRPGSPLSEPPTIK